MEKRFRIVTIYDPHTGRYYAEAYFPKDAKAPFGRTTPAFVSHEHAAQVAVEGFRRVLSENPGVALKTLPPKGRVD